MVRLRDFIEQSTMFYLRKLVTTKSGGTVEKRKISYFGLARNLIRHLISTNQDDLTYSARTFISGHQIL